MKSLRATVSGFEGFVLRGDKRTKESLLAVSESEYFYAATGLQPEHLKQIRNWCDKRLKEIGKIK